MRVDLLPVDRFEELKETPKKTKALPQAEKVKKAETEADTSMDVADVSLASADTSKLSKVYSLSKSLF